MLDGTFIQITIGVVKHESVQTLIGFSYGFGVSLTYLDEYLEYQVQDCYSTWLLHIAHSLQTLMERCLQTDVKYLAGRYATGEVSLLRETAEH